MSLHPTQPSDSTARPTAPGQDLERSIRQVGRELADSLGRVFDGLAGAPHGPKRLATLLRTTVVNTSRLLKAIACTDPVAVLAFLPGPEPLRSLLAAARGKGTDPAAIARASAAVESFDALIVEEGGDRGSFDAILSIWLPEQRRKFAARRRQAAFKALSELRGCSCDVDLSTILLYPSSEPGRADLVCLQGMYGLRRMRPGVLVKFGARRLSDGDDPRRPTNLDGEPAADGLSSVRLDDFCVAPPGPLVAHAHGTDVLYTLGDTGFGPNSAVDVVVGEVNRAELPIAPTRGQRRFFFHLVGTPCRRALFDVLIHRDLWSVGEPELIVYDTTGEGPANPNDSVRDVDRLDVPERIELLHGTDALRGGGVPRYSELVETACAKLGWDHTELRGYRVGMDHPLLSMQLCMAFPTGL